MRLDGLGKYFLTEIGILGVAEHIDQQLLIENVNPHARQAIAALAVDAFGVNPVGVR